MGANVSGTVFYGWPLDEGFEVQDSHHSLWLRETPIEIGYGSTYDEPILYVMLKRFESDWGDMIDLTDKLEDPSDDEVEVAIEFAKTNGIPVDEPRWYLTSLYG